MKPEEKIRILLNPRLREIHKNIGGAISMGDLAVYVGQTMQDAMTELVDFVEYQERQRAVEICDLNIMSMLDREKCARAIRDPQTKYPSQWLNKAKV
jgi:hypothetical protein